MEKLTFYSLSSPEKLDRIGEYLYQRATKDINRRRYKYVLINLIFKFFSNDLFFSSQTSGNSNGGYGFVIDGMSRSNIKFIR